MPVSSADLSRPEIDQFLDGDMKLADIIEVLESLSFRREHNWHREQPCRLVSLDREVHVMARADP
jgi:hypothetical protein